MANCCVLGQDCLVPGTDCGKRDKCLECGKDLHKQCGAPVNNKHGRQIGQRCLYSNEGLVCLVANKEAAEKAKACAKKTKNARKQKGTKKKTARKKRVGNSDAPNESVLSVESSHLPGHEAYSDYSVEEVDGDGGEGGTFQRVLESFAPVSQSQFKGEPDIDDDGSEAFENVDNGEDDDSLYAGGGRSGGNDEVLQDVVIFLEDGEVVDLCTLEDADSEDGIDGSDDTLLLLAHSIIFDESNNIFKIPLPTAEPETYWKMTSKSETVSINRDDSSAAHNGMQAAFPSYTVQDAICAFHAQPYYWGRRKTALFRVRTQDAINAKKKLLNNDFMRHKNVPFEHLV